MISVWYLFKYILRPSNVEDMIEKIDIADISVVDNIRNSMAVATAENKGLMSMNDRSNLRAIDIKNIKSKLINLGRVYGLFRFTLWSDINEVSLYLIDATSPSATYVAGYNIATSYYSFVFESDNSLILSYNGIVANKVTHLKGLAEAIR